MVRARRSELPVRLTAPTGRRVSAVRPGRMSEEPRRTILNYDVDASGDERVAAAVQADYEAPLLIELGSVEDLTTAGGGGAGVYDGTSYSA